jgi:hypothetical protein
MDRHYQDRQVKFMQACRKDTMSPPAYHTRDLYLAGTLLASGFTLEDVQRDSDGRCTFVYTDQPERKNLVVNFYDGSATVSALAFADALRRLKSRIHR